MKPSSDPTKLDNPLTIDEEDDDFDIVINNSGKEAYNPFAPHKDDSDEIVLINKTDDSAEIPIPQFDGQSKKCLYEKNLIDSDSITENDTLDSLTTFISTLDHYEALLNKRKKEKTTTFDSFQQLIPAPQENDLKVSSILTYIFSIQSNLKEKFRDIVMMKDALS